MVKKQELVATRATPPFYLNCDLRTFDLRSLNSAFDVVLIDPPWEECVSIAFCNFSSFILIYDYHFVGITIDKAESP